MEEFYKEYKLSKAAYFPITNKQLKFIRALAERTGSKIEANVSIILKRMEFKDGSEAIDLMKAGYKIRIH